jgi:threonine/homoserine/homoserine lactone efflux protein
MQDWRALANLDSLRSYNAWLQEGYRRSGFLAFLVLNPLLISFFTVALQFIRRPTRVDHGWMILAAALLVYMIISIGLMLYALLRLNAWKRANPWSPPVPRRLR